MDLHGSSNIQDYGLVSPERVKNLLWYFFKKYGTKKVYRQDVKLNLAEEVLCTICLVDQDRRRYSTVKLGKDKSRIHSELSGFYTINTLERERGRLSH
jgi:hypothetical protein